LTRYVKNLTTPELQATEAALRADIDARKRNGDKPEWLQDKIAAGRTGKAATKRTSSKKAIYEISRDMGGSAR